MFVSESQLPTPSGCRERSIGVQRTFHPRGLCVLCVQVSSQWPLGGRVVSPSAPWCSVHAAQSPQTTRQGQGGSQAPPWAPIGLPGALFLIKTHMGTRVTRSTPPPSGCTYSCVVADFALTSSREYSESEDATWFNRKLRSSCVQWTNKSFLVGMAQSGFFFLARCHMWLV